MAAALALPAPARDVLEPNDGITFVNGSVFSKPDPYVWRGSGRRTLDGSADKVEDPFDVYRIRLAPRSARGSACARRSATPTSSSSAAARSRSTRTGTSSRARATGTRKIDAVTIRNTSRSARRFYVAIGLSTTGSGLNAAYNLQFQRQRYPLSALVGDHHSSRPGRYVGTEVEDLDDEVFEEKLAAAHVEVRELAARAAKLQANVDQVLAQLLAK